MYFFFAKVIQKRLQKRRQKRLQKVIQNDIKNDPKNLILWNRKPHYIPPQKLHKFDAKKWSKSPKSASKEAPCVPTSGEYARRSLQRVNIEQKNSMILFKKKRPRGKGRFLLGFNYFS